MKISEIENKKIEEIRRRMLKTSSGRWEAWIEGITHSSGDSFIRTNADSDTPKEIYIINSSLDDIALIGSAKSDINFLLEIIDSFIEK